ncbi:DUF4304 domain-containing protein [Paenibacillus tundrae]|uniref:DUF4304 domain-containing protein n=1 Tax=Paenibacillus tundrae TaxID=528187 RepID=UPI0030D1FCE0
MQKLFQEMIKNDIKPYFTKQGYSKQDLNFQKTDETLVYKFNIQKVKFNTVHRVGFYINISVHSTELAELQSGQPGANVVENKAHFICRIRELVPSAPDDYVLTAEIDPELLKRELLAHLEEAMTFLYTLTSARDIVEYYMAKTALHLSDETFRFLLQTGDTEEARHYLQQLHTKYGDQKRWAIFDKKFTAIFAEYGMKL